MKLNFNQMNSMLIIRHIETQMPKNMFIFSFFMKKIRKNYSVQFVYSGYPIVFGKIFFSFFSMLLHYQNRLF